MSAKDIQLDTKNNMHMYSHDGVSYPSVTTVLDLVAYNSYLMKWANSLGFRHKNYEAELQKSADLGSYVHASAQHLVDPEHGELPVIADPMVEYYCRKRIQALQYRLSTENYETVLTETSFVSTRMGIGGTVDWLCKLNGKLTLFDFKSSKEVRDKFLLQLGGYTGMLRDNGYVIEQGGIILCKEDRAIIKLFPLNSLELAEKAFMQVKGYYDLHDEIHQRILVPEYVKTITV